MYIGCTNNLKTRISNHNQGLVKSTVNRRPLEIIFYEAFLRQDDAFQREKWLKTGWGRNHIQKMLHNYLKNLGG
ncbi:MAG: GIY-YIG nuclease family protein [bacterium]|nr:GIY-YIG nuclease family protein [bacterium]